MRVKYIRKTYSQEGKGTKNQSSNLEGMNNISSTQNIDEEELELLGLRLQGSWIKNYLV